MTEFSELLGVAVEAVSLATELVRRRLPGAVQEKDDRDMVSEVDLAVEHAVRELLSRRTPGFGFLGEEEGKSGDQSSELSWSLDPIDGTANFVHGIPLCATSLGLVASGEPVLGVIDLPFLGARYTAIKKQGAYRDGKRITSRVPRGLDEAIIAIGDYAVGAQATEKNRVRMALTSQLAQRVQRIRMLGSAAIDLAWVAEGKLDASVMFANKPWDTSAGVVIAREAGAVVIDIDGTPHTSASVGTVAVAKPLAGELLDVISGARGEAIS